MNIPKVFFSCRFSDRENVEKMVAALLEQYPNLPLEPVLGDIVASNEWRQEVESSIQKSEGFVCVIGKETWESPHVGWEIKRAHAHQKPIVLVKLNNEYRLPEEAKPLVEMLKLKLISPAPVELALALINVLLPQAILKPSVDLKNEGSLSAFLAQYTTIVTSWESLISRRQQVNTVYSTIMAAVLGGIGAFAGSYDKTGIFAVIGGAVLAAIGGVMSYIWHRMLNSYGIASGAKSNMVDAMEAHLPSPLFKIEWQVMDMRKYVSTNESDARTAKFFGISFTVLSFLLLALAVWLKVYDLLPKS